MTVNKKRKQAHEKPAEKKKKVTEAEDEDCSETKTKGRKKESVTEDEYSDQLNLKKKKNKKRKVSFEFPEEARSDLYVEGHRDLEQEESDIECSKEGRSIAGESHGTDTIHNDEKSYKKRKKRKKKKSDSFLPLADNQNSISADHYSPTAINDFGERHRKEMRLTDKEERDTTENPESVRETKKKKKKKSKDVSSLKCKDGHCYSQRDLDEHLPTSQEVESEEEEPGRKLGKQSQKITPLEINKKNKERKMKPAECVTGDTAGDGVLCNSSHMLSDKKRKKVPEDSAEESRSNTSVKKKKIKIEDRGDKMLEDVDDVIIQGKKGNCDEMNIDKVRQQALQEETDRESGKMNILSPKENTDTKIGQWSTAAFQTSEQGMKFLRLMGGFKKGSAPVEGLSVTTNKPNMALNREGEEKLQQSLKMEFDKAMDLKQHKRIGLGFHPAANKKVYIDKYASRSIKFED
uniref:Lysine rich nucleolar protein 1 n=1 Tax=Coturnix japonica TaxID=93934 RepID=A0A8C2U716_COTJA